MTDLKRKVALVAGATRAAGRGIAVELGAKGATVYCTGRSTKEKQSEMDRPETIDETAELVTQAGGKGIAVAVDHAKPEQVEELVKRIDDEQGRLDVLVNDIWARQRWSGTRPSGRAISNTDCERLSSRSTHTRSRLTLHFRS